MSQINILLLEPDEEVASRFKTILNQLGYLPSPVSGAEDAVEQARIRRPNLLLANLILPGNSDGFQAAVEIRKLYDIPVVFMSPEPEAVDINRVLSVGASGFLPANCGPHELQLTIEIALKNHVLRRDLLASEQRFIAFMKNSPVPVFWEDSEGHLLYINPAYERALGFQNFDWYGKTRLERWDTEAVLHFDKSDAAVLESGAPLTAEETVTHKDGSRHVWLTSKFPFRDSAGKLFLGGMGIDLSHTKQVEQSLRENEARLRTIFQGVAVAITEVDYSSVKAALDDLRLSGIEDIRAYLQEHPHTCQEIIRKVRLLDANEATLKLYGVNNKQMLVDQIHFLVAPVDETSIDELVAIANGQSSYQGEFINRTLDGRLLHLYISLTFPGAPEDYRYALASTFDLSEIKKAEEKIRFQAHLLDSVGQAVIATDPDWKIIYWNNFAESMYGWHEHEISGRHFSSTMSEASIQEHFQQIDDAVHHGNGWEGEYNARGKDGTAFPVYVTHTPVHNEIGSLMAIISVSKDISERVRTQETISHRLKIERSLARISQRLILDPDINHAVLEMLKDVNALTSAEQTTVVIVDHNRQDFSAYYQWDDIAGEGIADLKPTGLPALTSEALEKIVSGEILRIRDIGHAPDVIKPYLPYLKPGQTRSVMTVPWKTDIGPFGFMTLMNIHDELIWEEESQAILQVIAQVFGTVYQKQMIMQTLEQRVADRTRELSALYRIASTAYSNLNAQEILDQSLSITLDALGRQQGMVHLVGQDGHTLEIAAQRGMACEAFENIHSMQINNSLPGWVVEHDTPVISPDISQDHRHHNGIGAFSYLGAPMRVKGHKLGVISIFNGVHQSFQADDVALLTTITDRISLVYENAQLQIVAEQNAIISERQRLARELHDLVTQSLYSLMLMTTAARKVAARGENMERLQKYMENAEATAHQTLREMRLLIYELRPDILTQEGLIAALGRRLEAVEKRAGIDTSLVVEGEFHLTAQQESELYGIAQEALNNALKHAQGSSVAIHIRASDKRVIMEIVDDGIGFNTAEVINMGGVGLTTMRERAERVGGRLSINASAYGTLVSVVINTE